MFLLKTKIQIFHLCRIPFTFHFISFFFFTYVSDNYSETAFIPNVTTNLKETRGSERNKLAEKAEPPRVPVKIRAHLVPVICIYIRQVVRQGRRGAEENEGAKTRSFLSGAGNRIGVGFLRGRINGPSIPRGNRVGFEQSLLFLSFLLRSIVRKINHFAVSRFTLLELIND